MLVDNQGGDEASNHRFWNITFVELGLASRATNNRKMNANKSVLKTLSAGSIHSSFYRSEERQKPTFKR